MGMTATGAYVANDHHLISYTFPFFKRYYVALIGGMPFPTGMFGPANRARKFCGIKSLYICLVQVVCFNPKGAYLLQQAEKSYQWEVTSRSISCIFFHSRMDRGRSYLLYLTLLGYSYNPLDWILPMLLPLFLMLLFPDASLIPRINL